MGKNQNFKKVSARTIKLLLLVFFNPEKLVSSKVLVIKLKLSVGNFDAPIAVFIFLEKNYETEHCVIFRKF